MDTRKIKEVVCVILVFYGLIGLAMVFSVITVNPTYQTYATMIFDTLRYVFVDVLGFAFDAIVLDVISGIWSGVMVALGIYIIAGTKVTKGFRRPSIKKPEM